MWNHGTYLASSAKAKTPAASGAAAEVPEWRSVQFPYRSVVAWRKGITGETEHERLLQFCLYRNDYVEAKLCWFVPLQRSCERCLHTCLASALLAFFNTFSLSHLSICISSTCQLVMLVQFFITAFIKVHAIKTNKYYWSYLPSSLGVLISSWY